MQTTENICGYEEGRRLEMLDYAIEGAKAFISLLSAHFNENQTDTVCGMVHLEFHVLAGLTAVHNELRRVHGFSCEHDPLLPRMIDATYHWEVDPHKALRLIWERGRVAESARSAQVKPAPERATEGGK